MLQNEYFKLNTYIFLMYVLKHAFIYLQPEDIRMFFIVT